MCTRQARQTFKKTILSSNLIPKKCDIHAQHNMQDIFQLPYHKRDGVNLTLKISITLVSIWFKSYTNCILYTPLLYNGMTFKCFLESKITALCSHDIRVMWPLKINFNGKDNYTVKTIDTTRCIDNKFYPLYKRTSIKTSDKKNTRDKHLKDFDI